MSLFGRFFKGRHDSRATAMQPQHDSKSGIGSGKPDCPKITAAVNADLWQAILQTEDIPVESAECVHEVALRSAVNGDLYALAEALKSLGIESQRATELCKWLASRGKSLITRDTQIELGIKEAIWVYSGAPCTGKPPDDTSKIQDESHRLANGHKFNVAAGFSLNGKNTWPGYEQYCKCSSKPVIPF